MANKYIRQGETFNGDGTSSAAATSNGGVGAWNTLAYMEGTAPAYGSLAAGDTVYIRSKTPAPADITRTLSASTSLGSTSGTVANPITWVIDGGTVWSGVNGIVKWADATGNYTLTFRKGNIFTAEVPEALVAEMTQDWPGVQSFLINGIVRNALIQTDDTRSGGGCVLGDGAVPGEFAVLENCHIKLKPGTGVGRLRVIDGYARLLNCDIEITNNTAGQFVFAMLPQFGSSRLEMIGGRVRGAGATSSTALLSMNEGNAFANIAWIVGASIPIAMPVSAAALTKASLIEMVGVDSGLGSHIEGSWGWATSRTDNNPPTLSAQLPTSTLTPWAWRVYPRSVTFMMPACLPTTKVYTGSAAAKTVTQEFLVANTLSPTARNCWITVDYIDNATGLPKHVSTFDPTGAALASSTAGWSFSTWGLVSFNKKKIAVTTPTSVKQDTPITVTFYFALPSASVNDILFVDPDFGVS